MPQDYQVVNVPNVGRVRFPTSMDDAAVLDAVKKLSQDAPLSPQQRAEMAAHPEGGPSEPGTFWGGFLKSIKDQLSPGFSAKNQMLQNAAHPESLSDFLSLIIPSEVGEAAIPAAHLAKAGMMEASEGSPGIVSTARNFMKGANRWAFPTDPHLTMPGPGGFSRWTTGAKPRPGYFGPAQDAAEGVDAVGQAGVNELPAYLQQQLMDEAGSGASAASGSSRVGMPPARGAVPTPPQVGRVVGKAPTLEEELLKAVEGAGAADKPMMSTGAPDLTSVGEGPLKQSGKFSKSESLGQAGGYTSGNPATGAPETGQSIEEILAADPELQSITDTMGHQSTGAPDVEVSTHGPTKTLGPERLNRLAANGLIDTTGWKAEDWASLRRAKGARDAGTLTGRTAEEVRQLSGGGASQTPLEAEERIRAAANRAQSEE